MSIVVVDAAVTVVNVVLVRLTIICHTHLLGISTMSDVVKDESFIASLSS